MVSTEKNTMGWTASSNVKCGIAATAKMHDAHHIVQPALSSFVGSFHADTNVGIDPRKTTLLLVIIPSVGLLNNFHKTMPTTAPNKQNLSSHVQPFVPYFRAMATTTHAQATDPTI